jgi:hypothetical protein
MHQVSTVLKLEYLLVSESKLRKLCDNQDFQNKISLRFSLESNF